MARKERVVYDFSCDVCGDIASTSGGWYSVEYLNDEVFAEYSCPIDLCEKHMSVFARQYSDVYKSERYDKISDKMKEKLIASMKEDEGDK